MLYLLAAVAIGLSLVGLLYVLYKRLQRQKVKRRIAPPYKIAVLLTTYITSEQERKDMYLRNIQRWLRDTDLDIYVVDSSNQGVAIQHPRLKVLTFDQAKANLPHNPTLSYKERTSLLKAYAHFEEHLQAYDYVFKITGKYVIPQLQAYADSAPPGTDVICQNLQITHGQNTELLGVRPYLLAPLVSKIENTEDRNFERIMHETVQSSPWTIHRLLPIPLDQSYPRSDGSTLKELMALTE